MLGTARKSTPLFLLRALLEIFESKPWSRTTMVIIDAEEILKVTQVSLVLPQSCILLLQLELWSLSLLAMNFTAHCYLVKMQSV